jgi:hypothetical protein
MRFILETKEGRLPEIVDFTDWAETHHEVVSFIATELAMRADSYVAKVYNKEGIGGMYELGIRVTNAFQKKYKDVTWGEDAIFFDEIEEFLDKALSPDGEKMIREILND